MTQHDTENQISVKQGKVAAAVADDELTDEEISKKFKIGRKTLHRWKALPQFARLVAEIVEKARQAVLADTIAKKEQRVDALIDRQRRMVRVIEERAAFYKRINDAQRAAEAAESESPDKADDSVEKNIPLKHAGVPGAETGLLVHEEKITKYGSVDVYKVDTALLKEMRETEKQVAIELGEWTEKREDNINIGLQPDVKALIEKIYGDRTSPPQ